MKDSIFSVPIQTGKDEIPQDGMLSVGWHPWFLNPAYEEENMRKIALWSTKDNVLAIGETGLDRLCKIPFEYQRKIFLQHIEISEARKKTLIIHCVRHFSELLAIKKTVKPKIPWILHGFNNRIEIAKQLLKEDIKLSFGTALLDPLSNASNIIRQIKAADFFLETDDGRATIEEIYEKASSYRHVTYEELAQIQEDNFTAIIKSPL